MSGYWNNVNFSYVTGAVRFRDLAYLSLVDNTLAASKITHSYVKELYQGIWGGNDSMDVEWDTVAATIARRPLEQGLILGEQGQVMCIGSGDFHLEQITTPTSSPPQRGPMRSIRTIGDSVYAVGMDRQVYRRDSSGRWSTFDAGLPSPQSGGKVSGFESIDGYEEEELYAVGWDGEIWCYEQKIWSQKDSPTNFILVDVCCGGNGTVYACGRLGTLLAGRGDSWAIVDHNSLTDDIWSMAWFRGKLYLATIDSIYTLENDALVEVEMGEDQPGTCFHLSHNDDVLWSIGSSDIMSFDGTVWSRID